MKPLRLSMSAFGPYAGVQELDFSELKDKNIFLIHGPTGSGKTSILDAICFALYGDTSGAERDYKTMRSHHADINQLTEVTFDFELRGEKYRVKRIPEQERPKMVGTGTTKQLSEATIWRLKDEGEEIITTRWSNVTSEVEKIIGFQSGQFRQVIMLPQGKFRELLTAPTEKRQEILEKLFRTEIYRRIEEELKESAKKLKNDIEDMDKKKKIHLDLTECENINELEEKIKLDSKDLEGLSGIRKNKEESVKSAQSLLEKARVDNDKIKEKEDREVEYEGLKAKVEIYREKREELGKARKALTLLETEKMVLAREGEFKDSNQNMQNMTIAYKKAVDEDKKAQEVLEAENNRENEREEARKRVITLRNFEEKVKSLDSIREDAEGAEKNLKSAANERDTIKNNLNSIQGKIEDQEKVIKEYGVIVSKIPYYKSELDRAKGIYDDRISLEEDRGKLGVAFEKYNILLKEYEDANRIFLVEKEELLNLQELWIKGQAAILAKTLEEGKPCPVCGSTHHPRLAESEGALPSEEEINEKKKEVQRLEKVKDEEWQLAEKARRDKEGLELKVESLENKLGDSRDFKLEDLEKNKDDFYKLHEGALQKEKVLKDFEEELAGIKGNEKEIRSQLEEKEKEVQNLNSEYINKKTVFEESERAIPENIRTMEQLNEEIKSASKYSGDLDKAYNDARTTCENSGKLLTEAKTSMDNAKDAFEKASEKYSREKTAFEEKLKKEGFENYEDFDDSKKDEEDVKALEKDISDFDSSLKSAKTGFERAAKNAEGLIKQDLEVLEEDLRNKEEDKNETVKKENSLSDKIKNHKSLLDKAKELDNEIKDMEKKYSVLGRLSEVSNGKNGYGMTFQRYVLGTLLEDITTAATERLKLMSRGRYHLRRTLDRARKNAAGGLDLQVFDTYTGTDRPVTTLSGGESFLASLSLALGLADVVQAYSGGISLDTIFVDEGFGTLDPESLDFAMNTLIDLQKGGRLVGIISHVPELKERIDARLEVMPVDKGSIAKFSV